MSHDLAQAERRTGKIRVNRVVRWARLKGPSLAEEIRALSKRVKPARMSVREMINAGRRR